jgi:hypothetical protein
LPPAAYQLKLSVSPATSASLTQLGRRSEAILNFEVVLAGLSPAQSFDPEAVKIFRFTVSMIIDCGNNV